MAVVNIKQGWKLILKRIYSLILGHWESGVLIHLHDLNLLILFSKKTALLANLGFIRLINIQKYPFATIR